MATALTLIPFLAAFHFFDALQVVASFVLRAYKLAIAPTVIHATALWGLGVVGGYLVAFGGLWGPPWGIAGMWLMQSLALALDTGEVACRHERCFAETRFSNRGALR